MMRNTILSLLAVLLVMYTTPPAKQVNEQPKNIKKQSIIQPLQPVVRAQKQELVKVPAPVPKPVTAPISDDKMFVYSHESGNNPGAINPSSGACGLGQALPCSKMGCSLSDYACQDAWFTNYMLQRYGSWANARSFWERNRWW